MSAATTIELKVKQAAEAARSIPRQVTAISQKVDEVEDKVQELQQVYKTAADFAVERVDQTVSAGLVEIHKAEIDSMQEVKKCAVSSVHKETPPRVEAYLKNHAATQQLLSQLLSRMEARVEATSEAVVKRLARDEVVKQNLLGALRAELQTTRDEMREELHKELSSIWAAGVFGGVVGFSCGILTIVLTNSK